MSFIISAAHVELLRIRHESKRKAMDRAQADRASLAWTCMMASRNGGGETIDAVDRFRSGLNAGLLNMALAAYWQEHAPLLKLTPVRRRLFVNPPSGIDMAAETAFTYGRDPVMNGAYGHRYASIADPLVIKNEGTHWDDVVIFWTKDIQLNQIYDRVLPGTVISVYEPGRDHDFWLQFLGFERLVPEDPRFKFNPIFEPDAAKVRTTIYGVEPV